jgi:hypothetical protein
VEHKVRVVGVPPAVIDPNGHVLQVPALAPLYLLSAPHGVTVLLPSQAEPAGQRAVHVVRVVGVPPAVMDPGGHVLQLLAPPPLYMLSAPHGVHVSVPAPNEKRPAWHGMHAACTALPGYAPYLPAGQTSHAAAARRENLLAGHILHNAWPVRLWNVAAGQGAHTAAPVAFWCEPAAQAPQAARMPAAAAAVPVGHGAQAWQMHCCATLQGAVLLTLFQTRTPSV